MSSNDEFGQESDGPDEAEKEARINRLLETNQAQTTPRPANQGNVAPDIPSLHLGTDLERDQFGVDAVSDEIFLELISYPTTDFIFFLSSSTLHRFREHSAIKQKIAAIDDSYHVHRAAFDYYKNLIPLQDDVFLGQFSIRKRSNIYGLVFGSQHPLGIHKFLQVAWKNDQIAGEANFDVERENVRSDELLLGFEEMKPKKIQSFEGALGDALRSRRFATEADVIRFCIEAGMTAQHAAPVFTELKKEKVLTAEFRVPNVRNTKEPRSITYL